jgi:hypothetical protein
MFEEYESKKRKQISNMKALLDYGMGFIILLAGGFFFFRDQFDMPINESFPPNAIDKIFGAICMVYGAWRIYRGYKKKYFK